MSIYEWLTITLICIAGATTPGPSILLIVYINNTKYLYKYLYEHLYKHVSKHLSTHLRGHLYKYVKYLTNSFESR